MPFHDYQQRFRRDRMQQLVQALDAANAVAILKQLSLFQPAATAASDRASPSTAEQLQDEAEPPRDSPTSGLSSREAPNGSSQRSPTGSPSRRSALSLSARVSPNSPRTSRGRSITHMWDVVRYVTGVYSDVHLQTTASPTHLKLQPEANRAAIRTRELLVK